MKWRVRSRSLPGRLAEILASEDRWSDALACLAAAVHADVAVAITPHALLGVYGLVPAEALRAQNPDELARALIRSGQESTWVHRCPGGSSRPPCARPTGSVEANASFSRGGCPARAARG